MNAHSHPIKFTDGLERELIEQDHAGTDLAESAAPLLKWLAAIGIAVGSLLVIAHGSHGAF